VVPIAIDRWERYTRKSMASIEDREAKPSQIITVTGLRGSNSYLTAGRCTPEEAWPP
jgi:hypothetical protein